jgi:hypothetical protein
MNECTDHSDRKGAYESGSASQLVLERQEHGHVDIIIGDPHRKGLDLEVSRTLLGKSVEDEVAIVATNATAVASSSPRSSSSTPQIWKTKQQILICVSCGFDAFVRDYHILTKQPGATTSGTKTSGRPPLPFRCHQHLHRNKSSLGNSTMQKSICCFLVVSDAIETLAIFTR